MHWKLIFRMRFIAELCERKDALHASGSILRRSFFTCAAAPFAFRHLGFGSARATGFLSASF